MKGAATRGSVSIRRGLLGSLLLVIALLSGTIMATTYMGSRQMVRAVSGVLIDRALDRTEEELRSLFDPAERELAMLRDWGRAGLLDIEDAAQLDRLLVPLLARLPQVSALTLADARGRAQHWTNPPAPRALDGDPRLQPWFRSAIERRGAAGAGEEAPLRSLIAWTGPYALPGSREPGLTASLAYASGGVVHVVSLDFPLRAISDATTKLRVGEHGKVMVASADGRLVGLPADPAFADRAARDQALLKRPAELSATLGEAARALLPSRARRPDAPTRFTSAGLRWWAQARAVDLGDQLRLAAAAMVPERDIYDGLTQVRIGIVVMTLGATVLAVLLAVGLARHYSQPIEALVRQSERIRQGDLSTGEPVRSNLTEVRRLAEAHERMRTSLRSLLKLERDLQLARQIQQNALPGRLPELSGFELAAWSEPAEETGGDTYDVIGYRMSPDGELRIDNGRAEGAVLLLADATGHGIGPALTAAELRAMLRMAVRMRGTLQEIAVHMNEQLCADLHAGRFITAWLAELDARAGTLRSFSAGQGPLLYYEAGRDLVKPLEADSPPFGIVAELAVRAPEPIAMGPGDVYVVLSDGITEAAGPGTGPFGLERVQRIVYEHRGDTAAVLLEALRGAVARHTQGVPQQDDWTALIVKRLLEGRT